MSREGCCRHCDSYGWVVCPRCELRDEVARLYLEHSASVPPRFDAEMLYHVEALRGLFAMREILREPALEAVMHRSVTDAGRRAEARR